MKKGILLSLGLGLALCSFAQQKTISFSGKVVDSPAGYSVYLYNNILNVQDSAKIVDGTFEITVPFTEASRYLFYSSYDMQVKKGHAPFGILVQEPSQVNIELNLDKGFTKAKITNSTAHALYESFVVGLDTDPNKAQRLTNLVQQHPNSYTSVFVLDRMGDLVSTEERQKLFQQLSPSLQQSYEGQRVADKIKGEMQSKIGSIAAEFTLKNLADQDVSLSQFKGKYILIDFWASWCGPCREEFPHIKKAYAAYKEKGFEVLGVSTDKNAGQWKKAVADMELPWVQLLDGQGTAAIALSKYAVTVLPTSFLIDKSGKIIAKDLRGDALEKELAKLLP